MACEIANGGTDTRAWGGTFFSISDLPVLHSRIRGRMRCRCAAAIVSPKPSCGSVWGLSLRTSEVSVSAQGLAICFAGTMVLARSAGRTLFAKDLHLPSEMSERDLASAARED